MPHAPKKLKAHIFERLQDRFAADASFDASASVVLVLIGEAPGPSRRPCLILNKRSRKVRQPGDLCFPGGGPEPSIDSFLAGLLKLPGSPLTRWPYWRRLKSGQAGQAARLARSLSTGLREGFEEMRLNPFAVTFAGPLPCQRLVIFQRVIQPMVAWVGGGQRFVTNWEVERIVRIPLAELLDPGRYRRYRIRYAPEIEKRTGRPGQDFDAYAHRTGNGTEILWGATYRITAAFLRAAFDFVPPAAESLPRIYGQLDSTYYTGGTNAG